MPPQQAAQHSVCLLFSIVLLCEHVHDAPVRNAMAVQAPPAVAALLLRSLTRLTSDVMPTPDAFLNSSTFVSVLRLCKTAVLHTMPTTL